MQGFSTHIMVLGFLRGESKSEKPAQSAVLISCPFVIIRDFIILKFYSS